MKLKMTLEEALKNAIRSGDTARKRVIRMALSAIKLDEVEKGKPLEETAILSILQKELKTYEETLNAAERGGRANLITESQAEINILREFLPQPLSQAALEEKVREAIAEGDASSPTDMGKVMKLLLPRLEGRVSGNEASNMVRKLLTQ